VVLGEPWVRPRRKRKARPWARRGESLFSLLIYGDLLDANFSDGALIRWNLSGVKRDLVHFFNQERKIELAKVNSSKCNYTLCVMQNQEIYIERVGANIVITERSPSEAVLDTQSRKAGLPNGVKGGLCHR
jgi:hypothetical protein